LFVDACKLVRPSPSKTGISQIIKKVGIITPYKAQVKYLLQKFQNDLGKYLGIDHGSLNISEIVEINTVDSF